MATIRDKIYTAVSKRSKLGTGPDGKPWVVWVPTGFLYCLTYEPDAKLFQGVMVGAYRDDTGSIPDPRHAVEVFKLLVADAMMEASLPEVTEAEVLARGKGATPDDIDLDQGEVHTVHQVLARLGGHDDLFRTGVSLVRLLRDSDERLLLQPMVPTEPATLSNWCDKHAITFYGKDRRIGGVVPQFLPPREGRMVLARGEWADVRKVSGISVMPIVRQDGTLATKIGYDEGTTYVIDTDPDLRTLPITEEPDEAEVELARLTIEELYDAFPWDPDQFPEASRANAIGLLLTTHLRRTFPSMLVPLHAVSAHAQGSGKTLVAGDLPGDFGGGGRSLLTYDPIEYQLRTRLTSEMQGQGTGVLCYDNVAPGTVFDSPFIAAVLTSETYDDRLLGGNAKLVVQQSRTLSVTGNQLQLGRDMAARSVISWLNPDTPRPEKRKFPVRLDDKASRYRERPRVVSAILTLILAWVQDGCPRADAPAEMRQFTQWAERMGGLLEFAGVNGHLANASLLVSADDTAVRMGVLLHLLHDRYGTGDWTSAWAAQAISERPELDSELPAWLEKAIERDEYGYLAAAPEGLTAKSMKAVTSKIGYACRNHVGTYYDGLKIERVGTAHTKVTTWKISEGRV
jgi:hypothetical protein